MWGGTSEASMMMSKNDEIFDIASSNGAEYLVKYENLQNQERSQSFSMRSQRNSLSSSQTGFINKLNQFQADPNHRKQNLLQLIRQEN